MGEILSYPVREDVKAMKSAIELMISTRNGAARNIMVGVCREILKRYRIRKISFADYSVELGKQGGVRIVPRVYTETGDCPNCKTRLYGDGTVILSIMQGEDADIVSYGCGGCGAVIGKWEQK